MQELYQNFSLQSNCDGTYDLIIRYDSRFDAEFSAEALPLEHMELGIHSASEYLGRFARGLRMRSAKIVAGGAVMAVVPIAVVGKDLPGVRSREERVALEGTPQSEDRQSCGAPGVVTWRSPLYSAPTRESGVVTGVRPGAAVTVLDARPGGWRKVRTADGAVGYLPSRRVCETDCGGSIQILTNTIPLVLRQTPSATSDNFGTVPAGERMLHLGSDGDFDRVSYGSITAYVAAGHLHALEDE